MMTQLLILLSVVGLSTCQLIPDAALIRSLVDSRFAQLDHSPQDGTVTQAEWDVIITNGDVNGDGCLTEPELEGEGKIHAHLVAMKMFNQLDHNHDACIKISDMSQEFNLIDESGDGLVSLQEFEKHFIELANKFLSDFFQFPNLFG